MPQGNIAWDDEYCFIDDKFREKVTESPGFKWVDEAKPHHLTRKEGFVATKPGAHLLLTVNTAETTKADVSHVDDNLSQRASLLDILRPCTRVVHIGVRSSALHSIPRGHGAKTATWR